MNKLNQYLRIGEAAHFLGVSRSTLRNWEKAGKIKTYRELKSFHRLFKIEDLEKILKDTELTINFNKK